MIYLLLAMAVALWYALGVCGFIYWWTSEFDLKQCDVSMALLAGLIGPIAWVMGAIIHLPSRDVVISKRGTKS